MEGRTSRFPGGKNTAQESTWSRGWTSYPERHRPARSPYTGPLPTAQWRRAAGVEGRMDERNREPQDQCTLRCNVCAESTPCPAHTCSLPPLRILCRAGQTPTLAAPAAGALREAIQERESEATEVPTEPSPARALLMTAGVWPPRGQNLITSGPPPTAWPSRAPNYVLIDAGSSFVDRQVCCVSILSEV